MSRGACLVCGESAGWDEEGHCLSCNALFDERGVAASLVDDSEPVLPVVEEAECGRVSGEVTDSLLDAFRLQFEQHKVALPSGWVERLHQLATATETSRRFATVFFIDLCGYTRLSELLGEEELDRLRKWYFGVCTLQVEKYGGFLIQLLGDAAFAAFGAPWSFERDSESALLCLQGIREEVDRKGSFMGHRLAIHAGAVCGVVNVRVVEEHGRKRPDLFGPAVNLAARLEGHAELGEILISDALADQVAGVFDLESRPAFRPKNSLEEIHPSVVVRHRGDQGQWRRHDVRFVGREDELVVLKNWLSVPSKGEFLAGRVLGEAGIGKTRLILQGLERLQDHEVQVCQVPGEPHHRHTLLHPIMDFLRQAAARLVEAGECALDDVASFETLHSCPGLDPSVVPTLGYVFGVEPHFSRLREIPPATLRSQVVSGLAAVVAAVAALRPFVFFLDDAQWCDQMTWEVLDRFLADRPHGLLLLVAGRSGSEDPRGAFGEPETGAPTPAWQVRSDQEGWQELRLRPLSPERQIELLKGLLDLDDIHPLLRERLLTETEGLPLYLIELANEIAKAETTVSSEGLVEQLSGSTSLDRQRRLVDMLQARLDRLTAARRAILQCAAVLGRHFSYSLLSTFKEFGDDLLAELYALKGLRMVREVIPAEELEFAFTPTLLRDVAYEMLTAPQRRRIHATVARLIETRFADRLDSLAVDLAFHWIRADRLDRARPYVRKAARRAIDFGVPQMAYQMVSNALTTARKRDQASESSSLALQQTGILEELAGKASRALGDYEQANRHFAKWLDVAVRVGNVSWQSSARFEQAITLFQLGHLHEARVTLEGLLAAGGIAERDRATYRIHLAGVKYRQGEFGEALRDYLAELTSTEIKEGVIPAHAEAWNNAGLACWQLGRLEEASRHFEKGMETYERIGNVFGQARCRNNQAIIAEKLGDIPRSLTLLEQTHALAEKIGFVEGLSAIETNRANIALLFQRWQEAQERSARALHFARMIRHGNSETVALQNLALALDALGHAEEAQRTIDEAVRLADSMGDVMTHRSCLLDDAWIALQQNRIADAKQIVCALPDEGLADDQVRLRETISLVVSSLEKHEPEPALRLQALAVRDRDVGLESYLRRIDAAILLARHGLPNTDQEALILLRGKALGMAG